MLFRYLFLSLWSKYDNSNHELLKLFFRIMRKRLFVKLMITTIMVLTLSSCMNTSPSESIINVIDTVEKKLYSTNSLKEMEEMHYEMLRQITDCLNSNHKGYRFVENEEEYDKVIKRLDRYNIIYLSFNLICTINLLILVK